MFKDFFYLKELFEKHDFDNPLMETLKILNILTGGSIEKQTVAKIECEIGDLGILLTKRKQGIPIEYVLGRGLFYGQSFICQPGALIPRKETELLVDVAIKKIKTESLSTIVDMGTGCGSIAISIALHTENTSIFASDLNESTVSVASKNIEKFNLENRITLFQGDLFEQFPDKGLENQIDVVVCNPPYIPTTSLKNLKSEGIDHEPEEAFNGGAFGVAFYQRLFKESLIYLKPEGHLVFEIGVGQEKLVSRLFSKNDGYHKFESFDDGENIRVICARKRL